MAKRRTNGEGSIRKRTDGRWEGRYTAGYDSDTGKQIFKNVLGKTQAEVREKLKAAIAASSVLDVKRTNEHTVATWVNAWFEIYSKPNVRESTARYYKTFIDHHVAPRLGEIKLNKLTTLDIQKFYNDLKDHGRIREVQKAKTPGLSVSSIRGIHTMLHNCLECAVQERLILTNPTIHCKLPKMERKEMKVLPVEQLGSYLKAADERGLLPMFFLELTCGLRKGELVALLWSDLDVAAKTISISKQAYMSEGKIKINQPKTKTSIRVLSVSQEAIDLLLQERAKHPNSPVMFPSPLTGEMYHPDTVVKLHQKILKDAGLEHIRFHDLRHTFATLALQSGVDVKTVSSMLGHSNAGFTLSTYTHSTSKAQEAAAETMGSLMNLSM